MSNGNVKPFLKWAGGKGQLLPELLKRVPGSFLNYYEPFLGGGALFFRLAGIGQLPDAYLSDVNEQLIDTYLAVRNRVSKVIEELQKHKNEEKYFYRIRELDPKKLKSAQRAARIIYLNKTCYNGLYRENSSGKFNVPWGKYKNPCICDELVLRADSKVLKKVKVERMDYRNSVERAGIGDFVYLDPPYHPMSSTAYFTSYDRRKFGEEEQMELAEIFDQLSDIGVLVMLSNSDTPLIRKLYKDYRIERVHVGRAINSRTDGRGKVPELIIRNYN